MVWSVWHATYVSYIQTPITSRRKRYVVFHNDLIEELQKKMKDWSWKYDHSLLFEADRYNEESKKYPQRWSIITRQGKQRKCMWYNLLTQEIKIRGKSDDDTGWSDRRGEWKKIFFDELQNKTNAS